MPNDSHIISDMVGGLVPAVVNSLVATAITPLVAPLGPAIAPALLATPVSKAVVAVSSNLITYTLFAGSKALANKLDKPNDPIVLNEEWDDTDLPLKTS